MQRFSIWVRVAVMLTMTALLAACAPKVVVPSIGANAAGIKTPGKFVWFDLFSNDMTASENFYEALFGWDIERTVDGVAAVKTIWHRGHPIGNVVGREPDQGPSQWMCSLSVDNVETGLEMIETAGGTILRDAGNLPNRGIIGMAADPQGAPIALLSSTTGDPMDSAPETGQFIGAELWTRDVAKAVKLYSALVGYEAREVEVLAKVDYTMLFRDGRPRAGVVAIPWDSVQPQWIPYVGVGNILQATIKAQSLGGTVLVGPDMRAKSGRISIIREPSGAVFGMQELK